jgi:hypothetical protein
MNSLAESLRRSPELLPHSLDLREDTVNFVRLQRAEYQHASFLDERVLNARTGASASPWPEVIAAVDAAQLVERSGFIFHIGHVGSTLVSRLVGAHPAAFSLREPLVLRTLAQMRGGYADGRVWTESEFESRLSGCLKLLSRTYDTGQTAIVKATSFVSDLASTLLSREYAPRALLMFVSPESYLATIFGGENSRREAKLLTPSRLRRLQRRLGEQSWNAATLSEGETLAAAWACEMLGLVEAVGCAGNRALPFDFDRFLDDPAVKLEAALRQFAIQAGDREVAAMLAGPEMRRYSKGPEFAYDAILRNQVLNQARAYHGHEIRRGLRWLDRAAERHLPVSAAMAFAAGAAA